MLEKKYKEDQGRILRSHEIYRLHIVEGIEICELVRKTGLSRSSIYRALSTFEKENPQEASLMKKKSKDIQPDDYQKLLDEVSSLKKELAEARLQADFYEEMVAFGKDVYGIDLKKAGTK